MDDLKSFVGGLGCPNGGGMRAVIGCGNSRIAEVVAECVPDNEHDRQSGVLVIGLEHVEQEPESLRVRYRTIDQRVVIDDFLSLAATRGAIKGFSPSRHSPLQRDSFTPISGSSSTWNLGPSQGPHLSRFRPSPTRLGTSAR